GTSFSTPIVAGIAALMRSVNANLTPAELSARLASSATPFPANTTGLPVCPSNDATTGECACPPSGQCGSGMANALAAVTAAERPIAAVAIGSGGALDASVSAPSCGRTIMGYAWAAGTGVTVSSTSGPTVTASGTGTLTLTVTDSSGATDVATITLVGGVATTTAPSSAGTATSACPSALAVNVAAPTVAVAFSPSSVGENAVSTLTITFSNSNPFALTQAAIDYTLPANLTIASSPQTTTSCTGGQISATYTSTNIAILGAVIPAKGGCNVVIPVESATAGTYTVSIAANALSTAPAGGNTAAASGNLTVNAPSHGGGAFSWPDLLIGAGLVVLIRPRRLRGRGR
ncbi:MAG: S8 family serine peptidase, partial [Gammaproteobacteria bacterium]|nr:S8 family serine peptidase [Gammaproteobacteria bacterium]